MRISGSCAIWGRATTKKNSWSCWLNPRPRPHRDGGSERESISEKHVDTDSRPIPVTISTGVATQCNLGPKLRKEEELVHAADTSSLLCQGQRLNRAEEAPEIIPGDYGRAALVQRIWGGTLAG